MGTMKRHSLISVCALSGFVASAGLATLLARPAEGQTKEYVVLKVSGIDGKTSFKAMADRDQDSFRKGLDEEYAKAKKTYAEDKKGFQKENPGRKFEKPEPQKPRVSVARRSIKSLNEAQKAASDLEKAEQKNGKEKGEKTEKGDKGSEKGGDKNGSKKSR